MCQGDNHANIHEYILKNEDFIHYNSSVRVIKSLFILCACIYVS